MSQYPKEIAVRYIKAWGSKDMETVASMVTDDVVFESPRVKLEGAEATLAALGQFSQVVSGIDIISALGDDREAMVMYDMTTGPFGTLRVVDHLIVDRGKVTSDSIVFDTYELRKAEESTEDPAPVVHFEIIGSDPGKLRTYYGNLFGWEFDTSGPVAQAISEAGNYGFMERRTTSDGTGIPGGVGGGPGYDPHVLFYVWVPDVEAALERAENLGGTRQMRPARSPGSDLVVGHFTDPEGNLIGLAGATSA